MIEGRERDGVYVGEDIVNLYECTISKQKTKAEEDTTKLSSLIRIIQKKYQDKAVKAWFITKDEVTAEQRTAVLRLGKNLVTPISFAEFQSRIVDFAELDRCRMNYAFGSVRDPITLNSKYEGDFIENDLVEIRNETKSFSVSQIAELVKKGENVTILGYYGVGKSMTSKQVYINLADQFRSKTSNSFPVYLNLRDHHGQTNPVEALERHARNIGFGNPNHLVRAWRAGYITLILDGFDEIAAYGWAGRTVSLREIRHQSMELIRETIKQNPRSTGLIVTGRINYFDSQRECENATGLDSSTWFLKIGDFTTVQAANYLAKRGITAIVPEWIPTRPLLLGHLVARGILNEIISDQSIDGPVEGWDFLVDEVCRREANIEAGLTPAMVREILERVATIARKFQDGLGPISQNDLEKVFTDVCGYPPSDRAFVLLQRLPGLAPRDQQDGSRYFIDQMYASTLKAGELVRYISNPYSNNWSADPRKWSNSLDTFATQVLAYKCNEMSSGLLEDAILQAKKIDAEVLAIDVLMCLNLLAKPWTRESLILRGGLVPSFELMRNVDWSRVTFREAIFSELYLEESPREDQSPKFEDCVFGKVFGCSDESSLSQLIFIRPDIESFEKIETTTAALLNLDLPTSVKVGLTILKKLYLQSGGARQENAFFRGLSTNEQQYVTPLLELFKQHNLVIASKRQSREKVWQPVKDQISRVRNLLLNKFYGDPIVKEMRSLS